MRTYQFSILAWMGILIIQDGRIWNILFQWHCLIRVYLQNTSLQKTNICLNRASQITIHQHNIKISVTCMLQDTHNLLWVPCEVHHLFGTHPPYTVENFSEVGVANAKLFNKFYISFSKYCKYLVKWHVLDG